MPDRRNAATEPSPRYRHAQRALWCGAVVVATGLACSAAAGRMTHAGGGIQNVAKSVRPSPSRASDDRSKAFTDGCLVPKPGTRSPHCVYGARRSATTVVLFGDSHALHYFPAVRRVANQRRWRLVVLTKSGCPPPEIDVYYQRGRRFYGECGAWRDASLLRIERQEKPAVVVTGGSIFTAVSENGQPLPRPAARQAFADGYAAVVKRLVADGIRVVAIRDLPAAPQDVPSCVARSMRHLRRCAFSKHKALPHPDPVTAALRRVDGVRVIDPAGRLCVGRLCPAVIDDILVYRQRGHLTATFAATMAPWLSRALRDVP